MSSSWRSSGRRTSPWRAEPPTTTGRAGYTAGRIGERAVPAYAEEEGVDPEPRTETFAEVLLEAESERWEGTRFLLRAGKAFGCRRKEAVVRFRPSEQLTSTQAAANGARDELRIGIEGPDDLALSLIGSAAGATPRPGDLDRAAAPVPAPRLRSRAARRPGGRQQAVRQR